MSAKKPTCLNVHKHIVTDEANRPVAVQIDYEDWKKIEESLGGQSRLDGTSSVPDLTRFIGTIRWGEDAVSYQRRVREEWPR